MVDVAEELTVEKGGGRVDIEEGSFVAKHKRVAMHSTCKACTR